MLLCSLVCRCCMPCSRREKGFYLLTFPWSPALETLRPGTICACLYLLSKYMCVYLSIYLYVEDIHTVFPYNECEAVKYHSLQYIVTLWGTDPIMLYLILKSHFERVTFTVVCEAGEIQSFRAKVLPMQISQLDQNSHIYQEKASWFKWLTWFVS